MNFRGERVSSMDDKTSDDGDFTTKQYAPFSFVLAHWRSSLYSRREGVKGSNFKTKIAIFMLHSNYEKKGCLGSKFPETTVYILDFHLLWFVKLLKFCIATSNSFELK